MWSGNGPYIRDSRIEVFSGANLFTFRGYADGSSIDVGAPPAGAAALTSNLNGMGAIAAPAVDSAFVLVAAEAEGEEWILVVSTVVVALPARR
jgi:hypothetical protein